MSLICYTVFHIDIITTYQTDINQTKYAWKWTGLLPISLSLSPLWILGPGPLAQTWKKLEAVLADILLEIPLFLGHFQSNIPHF